MLLGGTMTSDSRVVSSAPLSCGIFKLPESLKVFWHSLHLTEWKIFCRYCSRVVSTAWPHDPSRRRRFLPFQVKIMTQNIQVKIMTQNIHSFLYNWSFKLLDSVKEDYRITSGRVSRPHHCAATSSKKMSWLSERFFADTAVVSSSCDC